MLRLLLHVPDVLRRVVWDIANAWHARDARPATRAYACLEELDFLAVDEDRVLVDELGLAKDNVNPMLLAEILRRIMLPYLSPNFAHAFHDFREVDFNCPLDLESILCALSYFMGHIC